MEFDNILLLAVRQGDVNLLASLLSIASNPNLYLNRIYDLVDEQKCTLLMIACLNGHEDVIRFFLYYFKPDLEILNNILLEEVNKTQMFLNVSVLWAAASINNFQIVKLFVEHGANINHRTKTNSTPLRGACYNGNVDMARYLIKNGADIHIAKENNETNLMVSVWHKHLNMVAYLLDELGYDVNECDNTGYSSLYYAVACDSLELVEFLLNHGARNFRATRDQMSPLMWAAEKKRSNLVDTISPYCSLIERIEAKELLGSAFMCALDNNDELEHIFEYFCQALELRLAHNIPKILPLKTMDIFNNRKECQTLDQLEEIRYNFDSMYIEALLIRERLLGTVNEEYHHSIFYRGAVLADNGQHHRAVAYWIYELNLCQQHSICINSKNLRHFASLFSEMLFQSVSIPIDALLKVITVLIEELKRNAIKFTYNLYTLLFLITITTQSLEKSVISDIDRRKFYQQIHTINQRQYTTPGDGLSLLHLSLNNETVAFDYHIDRICKYPSLSTIRILLLCGADVNMIDLARNTPLHIFASNRSTCDMAIFNTLCDIGAHIDCVNATGKTPFDLASNLSIKQLFRNRMKLSLKCLCARLIQKNRIAFHDKVSTSLVIFVEKH